MLQSLTYKQGFFGKNMQHDFMNKGRLKIHPFCCDHNPSLKIECDKSYGIRWTNKPANYYHENFQSSGVAARMGEDMNLPWSLVTWDGRAQEETGKPGKQYVLVTIIRGSERECHALRYWLTVTSNFVDIRKLWPIIALSGCGRHGSSHSRWNWIIKSAE